MLLLVLLGPSDDVETDSMGPELVLVGAPELDVASILVLPSEDVGSKVLLLVDSPEEVGSGLVALVLVISLNEVESELIPLVLVLSADEVDSLLVDWLGKVDTGIISLVLMACPDDVVSELVSLTLLVASLNDNGSLLVGRALLVASPDDVDSVVNWLAVLEGSSEEVLSSCDRLLLPTEELGVTSSELAVSPNETVLLGSVPDELVPRDVDSNWNVLVLCSEVMPVKLDSVEAAPDEIGSKDVDREEANCEELSVEDRILSLLVSASDDVSKKLVSEALGPEGKVDVYCKLVVTVL